MSVTERDYDKLVQAGAGGWGPDSETYAATDATLRRAGVPELAAAHRGAVEALRAIRELGRVCDEFETCEHRACQDSYTAWALADQYLKEES